jgi:GTPase SAR1 family protein
LSSSAVLHIIGQQGVGKSTLARQLKIAYEAQGIACRNLTESGLHEPGWHTDLNPFRGKGQTQVLIVEHLDEPPPGQVQTGDMLIRLERAA